MQGPFLEIHEADGVRRIPLGNDPLTVGRHSDNRLVISDTMSSRFHCHISKSANGTFLLRDLNSSNGTVVNGKLAKFTQLWPGDIVMIGQTKMLFLDPSGQVPTRPTAGSGEIVELGRASSSAAQLPPSSQPAELDSAEAPEMLSEDDIVAEDDEPIDISQFEIPDEAPATQAESSADEPIPVDESMFIDDAIEAAVSSEDDAGLGLLEAVDARQVVESLVISLPNRTYGESDIALVSARGQLVHKAGAAPPGGSREAVDWLRLLLLLCARSRATDVHFEPKGNDYLLRMRVDGTMVEICRLPNAMGSRISALVKVLSEVDIAQKNAIQEGHFSAQVPRSERELRRIDYRVSYAPSVYGQKLVIRVLDTSYAPLTVRELQLPEWMCDEIERVVKQDSGMVLACGPTGSGKTTTLYALLRGSGVTQRNVITIEDPVEIQIEGATQIPVDETHGKSFSSLLRSTLRQDPDVILIGEIRDAETARIAMQAAITGHLVFSTVHSQNTTGAIFRLLDLGAEPYLVSQALQLVLAQRLVKELCQYCKIAVRATADQLRKMGEAATNVDRIYEPQGCMRCLQTGYSGRRAVFELLTATDEIRELITRTPTATQIQAALASTPFQRLQHSGFELVANGISSFDEVYRVVGADVR
jgi:general secretion pathway protein E